MLNNLLAELVRKGYYMPSEAIAAALNCTPQTAQNKLNGISPVTVPEAVKIIETYFAGDSFTIEYLFAEGKPGAYCDQIPLAGCQ